MIDKLRKKFVLIAAISVLLVIVFLVGVINIVNICNRSAYLDALTEQIYIKRTTQKNQQPEEEHEEEHENGGKKGDGKGKKDPLSENRELAYSIRYCTIQLQPNYEIQRVNLEKIVSLGEADIPAIVDKISASGVGVGWYEHYRYRMETVPQGYFVVVLDASTVLDSIYTVFFISLAVSVLAFLLVLILVWLLSRRAIQPIAEAYEKQKQFITNASHELKTPLTVISADAQILSLTYGENEWCDGINKQSELMCSLIGKMLQLAKLDEDGLVQNLETFNLGDAVYDTAMSFSGLAGIKGLTLNVETDPELYITGDEETIRQTVSILVDNALKYCDKNGTITVRTVRTARTLFREKAVITVRNTFSEAGTLDTEKLFDRFYRADQAHAANNSYGLGLTMAKAIIEKHNGTIRAAGEKDTIVFTVTLPLADSK